MKELLKISFSMGVALCCAMSDGLAHAAYINALNAIAGADKISHWGLEETTGTVASDSWTTGTLDSTNNGAYSGVNAGVNLDVAGPRDSDGFLGFGSSNNAVEFTGTLAQRLVMADSASFHGVGELTMTMWFRFANGQTGQCYLGGFGDTSTGVSGRYAFSVNSNANLRGFARVNDSPERALDSGTGGIQQPTTPANYRDGKWHFLVMTLADNLDNNNKELKIYVDNLLRYSNPIPSSVAGQGLSARQTSASSGSLSFGYDLGAAVDENGRAYIGQLDEIALVGRALNAEEIGKLFNAAQVPEPGSIILLSIGGLIGLVTLRQRRAMKK